LRVLTPVMRRSLRLHHVRVIAVQSAEHPVDLVRRPQDEDILAVLSRPSLSLRLPMARVNVEAPHLVPAHDLINRRQHLTAGVCPAPFGRIPDRRPIILTIRWGEAVALASLMTNSRPVTRPRTIHAAGDLG